MCVISDDLSTDQKYLAKIYNCVRTGSIDDALAVQDPGNISHARWLTTANRFLRLYLSTCDPSENLVRIVKYIMLCYVPTWFDIKCRESIFLGSRHFYNLIRRCKALDQKTCDVVRPVIQHNAYFGHAECILLSMLIDEDYKMRQLAFLRIRKARESGISSQRVYSLSDINFQANVYTDKISWIYIQADPPILVEFPLDALRNIAEIGKVPQSKSGKNNQGSQQGFFAGNESKRS